MQNGPHHPLLVLHLTEVERQHQLPDDTTHPGKSQ
jgi:hypothetical protein